MNELIKALLITISISIFAGVGWSIVVSRERR